MSVITATAPGRVNLIGDHTDYSGGLVCPVAINLATTVSLTRGGSEVRLTSADERDAACVRLDVDDPSAAEPAWARYVAGVVHVLRPAEGGTGTVTSTLPIGAGLSSSAALEVAVALALGATPHDPTGLARELQRAEQLAAGVPCGIMDQLVSLAGVEGHALRIDCTSLAIWPVRIPDGVEILVVHSGEPRSLAGSPYAQRRKELEAGVERRVRHVVSENARVDAFCDALTAGDLRTAGTAMVESHASLRDDFEVSTPRIDALVADLAATRGVWGARLTGAGFGGCVVALADPSVRFPNGWVVRASAGAAAF